MKQEPSRIFLEPSCVIEHGSSDRLWCEDDLGECEECGAPSIEYIRADLVANSHARLIEALEASRKVITEIVHYVVDEGRMAGDENGDDEWFAEHGNEALGKITAALAQAREDTP